MDVEELLKIIERIDKNYNENMDEEKINQLIKNIIEKNIKLSIKIMPNGIQIGLSQEKVSEIAKEIGIDKSNLSQYFKIALKKISDTIHNYLNNRDVSTELEKLIIKKYFSDSIKLSYFLRMNPMFPILYSINIIKQKSIINNDEIEYFVLDISYDSNKSPKSNRNMDEHFSIALSKSQLTELYERLKGVMENEPK